jgi:hypothetical protein
MIFRQWAIKEERKGGLRIGATLDSFNPMLKIEKLFLESSDEYRFSFVEDFIERYRRS